MFYLLVINNDVHLADAADGCCCEQNTGFNPCGGKHLGDKIMKMKLTFMSSPRYKYSNL